jgi:hypothetical protein
MVERTGQAFQLVKQRGVKNKKTLKDFSFRVFVSCCLRGRSYLPRQVKG